MTLLCVEALRTPYVGPVSFHVSVRERVFITGPSGAGKTLFLRALADLDPSEGEVRIEGKLRESCAPAAWRKQVGFLPAESAWWAETAGEHFSLQDSRLLATLRLGADVMELPVRRLSTGERQRLALLRLLANQPRVLLLDEPTANLDGENERCAETAVQAYLEQTGACVLWVSHDREQIRRLARRALRFDHGRISSGPA